MTSRESQCLLQSHAATAYGSAGRRSTMRARLTSRRGMKVIIFASAAAILLCALASLLPSHTPRSSLLAATAKPSSTSSLHVSESPAPVINTEISKADHELGQAAAKQAEDVRIDAVEHDSYKQEGADAHSVAKLEGKLADLEKKPAVGKAVAAVEQDLKRVEVEENGLELGEHALHKDQAAEVELQNAIQEEESAIVEAEKTKQAVSTRMGHLKADLVSEGRLLGKINTETGEFAAAVHSYESDFAHVLSEEDAAEKQLISDKDVPDQQQLHKDLLDAHTQHEKEATALGEEVDGDKAVAQEFEDLSKDDQHVSHQESDNADAEGLSSSASHK